MMWIHQAQSLQVLVPELDFSEAAEAVFLSPVGVGGWAALIWPRWTEGSQ